MTDPLPPEQDPGTALEVRRPVGVDEARHIGEVLAASGYFADAKEAAQAAVKVMAGGELGFAPIASMTGINIVQGRVTIGANLLAAAIKRSRFYQYRVVEHSDEACTIEFYEGGELIGTSRFTIKDAEKAGLAHKANYKAHPKNMLFARAISNGAKWHCADLFGGPVYTLEEIEDMDADAIPETVSGVVVEDDQAQPEDSDTTADTAGEPDEDPPLTLEQAERLLAVIRDQKLTKRQIREALARLGVQQAGDLDQAIRHLTLAQATDLFEAVTSIADSEAIGDTRDVPWNPTSAPPAA